MLDRPPTLPPPFDATVPRPQVFETSAAALCGGRPALVLAPHPDDESLACGGLLAACFADAGAHVICLTDGGASHLGSPTWSRAALSALRRQEMEAALRDLGGGPGDLTWLGLPDAASDTIANLGPVVAAVIEAARRVDARSLFAPCETDPHCDHEVAAAVARAAACMAGLRLYSYPVWSRWRDPGFRERLGAPCEFRVDPGPWRAAKGAAIRRHRSQLGQVVHDAREAFAMSPAFVAMFEAGPEIFFEREPR
ncbi:PIG-L deacetylase family protein [Albimonas pacifica]|uniref:N-acetylglucosaminyl deacetylase, LmbE family n=1 Tax=Albimonas pacifica TaxID=1114924 RepID=A0A1I3LL98_9RHOB|nr:PIG-L deacetylase family protein [Albimonas pacifica]SFI85487.1 N-acetylglucosaminyl deacetylase, LmbE family [Albimonas pacifica]